MSRTVYYLRHGETDWNVAGRLQGNQDTPLNARGEGQAIHCGEVLRDLLARDGVDPGALDYASSPLMRARRTMELAGPNFSMTISSRTGAVFMGIS